MSIYIDKKFFVYYSGNRRRNLTFKFGKNKAIHPHPHTLGFEWSFHKDINFGFGITRVENKITFRIQLLWLSLFITYSGLHNYITGMDDERCLSFDIHHWGVKYSTD